MWLSDRFHDTFEMKRYHVVLLIIATMFFILFLYTAWPQFRSDAMEFPWYFYLVIMIICLAAQYKVKIIKYEK
ncbi:MAG: hypothetical protein ABIJ92_00685 [Candidatus Aenigmatarchaeota archaeon]